MVLVSWVWWGGLGCSDLCCVVFLVVLSVCVFRIG